VVTVFLARALCQTVTEINDEFNLKRRFDLAALLADTNCDGMTDEAKRYMIDSMMIPLEAYVLRNGEWETLVSDHIATCLRPSSKLNRRIQRDFDETPKGKDCVHAIVDAVSYYFTNYESQAFRITVVEFMAAETLRLT